MTTQSKSRAEVIRLLKKDGSAEQRTPQEMTFAVNYLTFFGYIAVELLQHIDLESIKDAVKLFQHTFGLKSDGILGEKTLRAMSGPRCGCPDHIDAQNKSHLQFMLAQEIAVERRDRWNKQGLTYTVDKFVLGKIPRPALLDTLAAAFKSWDDICSLHISEAKKPAMADIVISYGKGPRQNFDGRGGTLAWAYLPTGADKQLTMRFDIDETWVRNPKDRGVLLQNVACHEIGHLLGLTHSTKPSALMAPYYNPFISAPQADDDISRIVQIYGPNTQAVALREVHKVGDNLIVELQPGQKLTVTCK